MNVPECSSIVYTVYYIYCDVFLYFETVPVDTYVQTDHLDGVVR